MWSPINGLYFQILLQPLCALREIKLHQALTGPELWPYKNSAYECLQQSRAGRATRVLWSWGSRAFQHLHVRNKRQTVPRTRTQAQGKQACGACTDEEETLKSWCSPCRVQARRPGDTYWGGIRHGCNILYRCSLLPGKSHTLPSLPRVPDRRAPSKEKVNNCL